MEESKMKVERIKNKVSHQTLNKEKIKKKERKIKEGKYFRRRI